MRNDDEFWRTCFVIMPFGARTVGTETVDFDQIYGELFKPAIQQVRVRGNHRLKPLRADEPLHSRLGQPAMFKYVLLARIALADVTVENTNVGYELALRHSCLQSCTVIVRQARARIPFDLQNVVVNDYQHEPPAEAKASELKISRILKETLAYNDEDSPVYQLVRQFVNQLGPDDNPTPLGKHVVEAEEAARNGDFQRAVEEYRLAKAVDPSSPVLPQRRGVLMRQAGDLSGAKIEFEDAIRLVHQQPDLLRDLGLVQRGFLKDLKFPLGGLSGEIPLNDLISVDQHDYERDFNFKNELARKVMESAWIENALEDIRSAGPHISKASDQFATIIDGLAATKMGKVQMNVEPWKQLDGTMICHVQVVSRSGSYDQTDLEQLLCPFGSVSHVTTIDNADRGYIIGSCSVTIGQDEMTQKIALQKMLNEFHTKQFFGGTVNMKISGKGGGFGHGGSGSGFIGF